MKKRKFLKTTGLVAAGGIFAPLSSCKPKKEESIVEPRTNWAGNLTYSTNNLHEPDTIKSIQQVLAKCNKIRPLGTRHCFNQIADSDQNQVSVQSMDQIVELDTSEKAVTIEAGLKYGDICPWLDEQGFAFHNLASLPHISVVGGCATATHGSGMMNGNLTSAVREMEIVKADGSTAVISRDKDGDMLNAAAVHLGCLGVITRITLDVVSAQRMKQNVYLSLPVNELFDHFEEIMSAGYSVSLFTDWQSDTVNQVWIKDPVIEDDSAPSADFFGSVLADRDVHPIIEISAENCTSQMNLPGPWYERLPHFRMNFTPSSGEELQTEYFVPLQNAVDTFRSIQELKDRIKPLIFISEIRAIAADELWMSPCYMQQCIAFHFTWKQNWEGLQKLLPELERRLMAVGAKPHWGKIFTFSPQYLQSRYPRIAEFRDLVNEHDPMGKFRNDFIQRNLF